MADLPSLSRIFPRIWGDSSLGILKLEMNNWLYRTHFPWFYETPTACGLVHISLHHFLPFHTESAPEAWYLPHLSHLLWANRYFFLWLGIKRLKKFSVQEELGWHSRASSWNLLNRRQSFPGGTSQDTVFPVTAVTMKGHVLCILLTRNHFTQLGEECGENVWGTQLHRCCLLHAEAPRQLIA